MNKKQKVDALIANGGWDEEDREWLMDLDESRLDRMFPNNGEPAGKLKSGSGKGPGVGAEEEEDNSGGGNDSGAKGALGGKKKLKKIAHNEEDEEDEDFVDNEDEDEDMPKKKSKKVANSDEEETVEEYVKRAPKAIRDVLNAGMAAANAEKKKLIGVITGNGRNKFSKEALNAMSLEDLRNLAALANNSEDYSGAAGDGYELTENEELDDEPLALPTMNFEKGETRGGRRSRVA